MVTFREEIRAHLPAWHELLPVFSTLVFVVYSWALYRMFYQLPSWAYYLQIYEILILASYVLATALIESLVMIGFVCLISLILPINIYRKQFVSQGFLLAFAWGLGAFLIQRRVADLLDLELWQVILFSSGILGMSLIFPVLTGWVFNRSPKIARVFSSLADRMVVFSMIYVPLSVLGLVVVFIRNVF